MIQGNVLQAILSLASSFIPKTWCTLSRPRLSGLGLTLARCLRVPLLGVAQVGVASAQPGREEPDAAVSSDANMVWEPGKVQAFPGLLDANAVVEHMRFQLQHCYVPDEVWFSCPGRLAVCGLFPHGSA